ncbi:MAG: NAD(P)H-binding protein [Anaerolineae bacterium]|nr:NAD(P)H-binding protein [Anaerolineae bacterium]
MQIALFGGSGKTGSLLVQKAYAAGHTVVMLAADSETLKTSHAPARILSGDPQDRAAVDQVLDGAGAVISLLSPAKGQPASALSNALETILEGMHAAGLRRLVMASGADIGDPNDHPSIADQFYKTLLRLSAPALYEDMTRAAYLVRSSELDWTIVRIPRLSEEPATGKIHAGHLGSKSSGRVTRGDLAAFLLMQVESKDFMLQSPVISSERA